jgi:hypothetical protein
MGFKNVELGLKNIPSALVTSLETEEGRQMLAIQIGVPFVIGKFTKALTKQATELITQEFLEVASSQIGEKVSEEAAYKLNTAIISAVVEKVIEDSTTRLIAAELLTVVADSVDAALVLLTVIQFIGLFIDLYDPYGYNSELTDKLLEKIKKAFDHGVATKYLTASGSWPIEFSPDGTMANMLSPDEIKMERANSVYYTAKYLNNLEFNSFGDKLQFDKIPRGYKPYTIKSVREFDIKLSMILNNNLYAAEWVRTNWLWVLIGGVIVLALWLIMLEV